jgi:hypothetical protein
MSLKDRQRRTQEILDSLPRAVRQSHSGHEDSEPPPPIPSPYPPTMPGEGSRSSAVSNPPPHVRRLGNWGKYIAGIVAGGAALYTVGHPVVSWIITRPSDKELSELRTYCVGAAASAAASAVAPPGAPSFAQRFTDLEKKAAHESKRWDALDKWHRQQFQRRNAPPICQFGPKAESQSNVCTMEELKTP